jgi:hypothetical protein
MQIVTMLISRENSETMGRQTKHRRHWFLLGGLCHALWSDGSSTFRSSVLPPSSGSSEEADFFVMI